MNKRELILLVIILLGAFLVRLYKIDNPVADWHSWRQADTSAVSRNFVKYGIDLLHPRFDDLSKIPSGKENPMGYRFVEFPIYNAVTAILYKSFDRFSIEKWGRLLSVFSSTLSIVFIYLLSRKYIGERAAIFASFFFAFLPFNVYYGRAILPDTQMVVAALAGIYFFDKWLEKNNLLVFSLAIIFTTFAFLLKPFALFFTIPMIYLAYRKWNMQFLTKPQLWIFAVLTLFPLIFWRLWILSFPEGIPANDWLFNGGDIRFKGAFFYWIFADRIGRLILGYWGLILLGLGMVAKVTKKEGLFSFSFLLSALLYLVVVARGNVQHDYYQILIIPAIAIFLGKGAHLILTASRKVFNSFVSYILIIFCLFIFAFSWYNVRDFYNINNPNIIEAGKVVDTLTPKDAKVIAPYNGDSAFLYQTNRQGWPVFDREISEFVKIDASYLIIVNPTKSDLEGFGKKYKIEASSDKYLLLNIKE